MSGDKIIDDRRELLDYDSVETWMESLENPGEKGTKKTYLSRLKLFCNFIGKDPDALIEERKEQIRADGTDNSHEKALNKFLTEIEKENSPNYVHGISGAIRSFYKYNNLDLGQTKRTSTRRARREKIPSTEEVKKMADAADIRNRAIILFLFQTGLRTETAAQLIVDDIKGELDPEEAPVRIHVYPWKAKYDVEFDTFLGEDGVKALKAHFDERRAGNYMRGGEPEEIDKESPIFRTRNIDVKSASRHVFSKVVKNIALKTGVGSKFEDKSGREYSDVHAHCLRKAWQNRVEEAGVQHNYKLRMAGRKLRGAEGAYSKPSEKVLRKAYKKVEPALSISEIGGEKAIEGKLRNSEIKTLKASLQAQGVSEDTLDNAIENWIKANEILERVSEPEGVATRLSGRIDKDILECLSNTEFQDLKSELIELAIKEGKKAEEEGRQKLIAEELLEEHLDEGWKFVAENNGKIIVEKKS